MCQSYYMSDRGGASGKMESSKQGIHPPRQRLQGSSSYTGEKIYNKATHGEYVEDTVSQSVISRFGTGGGMVLWS